MWVITLNTPLHVAVRSFTYKASNHKIVLKILSNFSLLFFSILLLWMFFSYIKRNAFSIRMVFIYVTSNIGQKKFAVRNGTKRNETKLVKRCYTGNWNKKKQQQKTNILALHLPCVRFLNLVFKCALYSEKMLYITL